MSHHLMFISRNFCWFCGESDVITCLLNFNTKKKQLFLLKFQNILITLLGSQDTNNALFLDLFLSIFRKTYWVKRIPNKNFGHHFFMPTFAFSCRQASTKVISEPTLSSLTQTMCTKTLLPISVACVLLNVPNDGLRIWLNLVAGRLVGPLHTD